MSFYTSMTGLKGAQTDLDVISHNLANAETIGFKRSDVNFADLVPKMDPKTTIGIGARVESIAQSFTQGPIEQTGKALDVAIAGEGFFTTANGTTGDVKFTRAGNFQVDDQGFIVRGTSNERLQVFAVPANTAGPTIDAQIAAVNGSGAEFSGVTIDADGNVVATYADGTNTNIGRIALASFTTPTGLQQLGNGNWSPTGQSGAPTWGVPGAGKFAGVMSGALERANVDITEELVGLITAQRNFQANAKAIDTSAQITQTIINLRT